MNNIKSPVATVTGSHNHLDAELICAGQILYRDRLLDHVDVDDLNSRIGRRPGSVDVERGSWRLLFDAGYTQLTVTTVPDLDHVMTIEEWAAYLAELGTEVDDINHLRRDYPLFVEMQESLLRMRAEVGFRWHHEQRKPTIEDANRLIDEGWSLMVRLSGENGWARAGLVVDRAGDRYQVFDPEVGVVERGCDVFEEAGAVRSLDAWRR